MAIIAITTRSSMSVKPLDLRLGENMERISGTRNENNRHYDLTPQFCQRFHRVDFLARKRQRGSEPWRRPRWLAAMAKARTVQVNSILLRHSARKRVRDTMLYYLRSEQG